jgi:uncharacterized membrane protein YedE/YeeE
MALKKKPVVRKTVAAKTPRVRATTRKAVSRKPSLKVATSDAKNDLVRPGVYLGFGILFGYLLGKAGITNSDNILNMFLVFNKQYRSFELYKVIGIIILVMVIGVFLLERFKKKSLVAKKPIEWKPKVFEAPRLIGAAMFGAGWALCGACPSSAVAQLGEGKIMALFILAGILVGTWSYRLWSERR